MDDLPDDLLRILPGPSRAKLERLAAERQAAVAAYRASSDREQAARRDAALLEARVRQQLEMPPGIDIDAHPASAVVAARKRAQERPAHEARLMEPVEAAKRRLQIASDARERAAERQNAFAFLDAVETWLSRAASFGIGRLEHFAPKPPKTRDFPAEIERIRRELAGLDDAWRAAEEAPAPASALLEAAIAEIDKIATRGALTLDPRSRGPAPLGLAEKLRPATTLAPGGDVPGLVLPGDAGAALWTWLHRDALIARVREMAEALPQRGVLSDDERDARFAEISTRRLELERVEEALICAAEAEGRIIARRRDIDPRAVLEVIEA